MHSGKDQAGFDLVTVQAGVQSLRSREFGETFHPVVGPMIEAVALHVKQQRLVERVAASAGRFVIWDVGLGAAANAIAVLEAFELSGLTGKCVELHSFDHTTAPLSFALEHAEALGYLAAHTEAVRDLVAYGRWRKVLPPEFIWHFHPGDFRQTMANAPTPQAVLYDPYSPAANPELWTLDHFAAIRVCLGEDTSCLLTNYTRSTAVRVTLLLAGFFVGHGHATGEKDQTTIASNRLEALAEPLDVRWLERVRRSTKGAPLRAGYAGQPISEADFAQLRAHPQFQRP